MYRPSMTGLTLHAYIIRPHMEYKSLRSVECKELRRVAFTFPAIDNHAHSLLRAESRDDPLYEGLISEAEDDALKDAVQTLAVQQGNWRNFLASRRIPPGKTSKPSDPSMTTLISASYPSDRQGSNAS